MKNLKKIIAMGLTAALCAVSLAGCGGTQNGGTDGATDTNAKNRCTSIRRPPVA